MKRLPLVVAGLLCISLFALHGAEPQLSTGVTIVAFGDSTTAVRGSTKVFASLLQEELNNVLVINAGVGGNTTDMARKRFEKDVLGKQPQIVLIQFGINDSAVDVWKAPPASEPRVPLKRYETNLRHFVQSLKRQNAAVVLMTPNPLRWTPKLKETYGKPPYDPEKVDGFNVPLAPYCETVRRVAEEESVELLDMQQAFVEQARTLGVSVDSLLSDGMHPNDAGHRIEADIVRERVLKVAKTQNLSITVAPRSRSGGEAVPRPESRASDGVSGAAKGDTAQASPVVGAIRWDAWYGAGGVVKAVEYSLGQPKYHFRLPWFSELLGNDKVRINGDSPGVMDLEISYASQAGLNYWGFLHYWRESADLGIALRRYLATANKKGVRYCMIEEGGRLDRVGAKAWTELVEHFRSPDYQKVLGGRPILFVYIKPSFLKRSDWDDLKRQTLAAGLEKPYLVLMGWNPEQDARDMTELGFDAVSAYARGGSYDMNQPSYEEQGRLLKKRLWDKWAELKVPCVTLASAGWDTRPRNERPPEWIKNLNFAPDPEPVPFESQKPLVDSVTGTPAEVAAHIAEALQWTKAHRDVNPSNTLLIYAWNEHDEGGWLQPTLGKDGVPNTDRIKALEGVLRRPVPGSKR